MTKWTLPEDDDLLERMKTYWDYDTGHLFTQAYGRIKSQSEYIERLEQAIKNMTAHIRVDPDE